MKDVRTGLEPSTEAGPIHAAGCRCWPHVSQQDAVRAVREAFIEGARQEYTDPSHAAAVRDGHALREALKELRLRVWHADYCAVGVEDHHCICGLTQAIVKADAALSATEPAE